MIVSSPDMRISPEYTVSGFLQLTYEILSVFVPIKLTLHAGERKLETSF